MAPSLKRARHQKVPEKQANKRRRTSGPRRAVALNDLAWSAVAMPDRLDDYEGFFGLEEVEDVDVVRDEATGKISFETTMPRKEHLDPADAQDNIHETATEESEDEWEGFGEEKQANGKEAPAESVAVEKESTDKQTKKKEKEKRKEEQEQGNIGKQSNGTHKSKEDTTKGAFDILAEKGMDEEPDEEVDVSAWEQLGLSKDTLSSLSRLKFSQPTPIQSNAIPEILAGHDVIGKASTGSGKTLAFGIPILESYLVRRKGKKATKAPLALIISPTRELAHQITAHLANLCSGGDFAAPYIATITGGLSVQKQRRLLEKADIIVGTPGRLWEVISEGHGLLSSLKQIRFLVVDEADRLLSQGHYKELGEILNVLDRGEDGREEGEESSEAEGAQAERQTLVFSATFHKGLQQKLAGKKPSELMNKQESMEYLLKKLNFREEKPKFIDVNRTSQMATGLKEGLIECGGTEKDLYLYGLLLFHPKKRALIFTNSISAVRRITPFLQNLDLPTLPLHSQMPQKARLRSVERFTERPGSILVATDVAARGLDIPGVQLIVHYHLPRAADTYVHRSGRTARAEASGTSILICAPEEVAGVRRLVAKVHSQGRGQSKAGFIRTLDIDRRIVSRLRARATLAKKLADAVNAKEKEHSQADIFREAADDLGVDYDSEALENDAKGKRGRGAGRKKKEKEAREIGKGDLQAMRAELRGLLSRKVNAGVSAKYLTGGGIDVDALLRGEGNLEFLGSVEGLGFEDE